jgi:hypothetical protein
LTLSRLLARGGMCISGISTSLEHRCLTDEKATNNAA